MNKKTLNIPNIKKPAGEEAINIIIVEDDDSQIQIYKDAIDENNHDIENIKICAIYLKNDKNLYNIISEKRVDTLIIDLNLGPTDYNNSGNDIIDKIYMNKRIPIFVVSGNLNNLKEPRPNTDIFKVYNRSDVSFYEILDEIKKIYLSGYTKIFGHPGKIDKLLNEVFWKYAASYIETWCNEKGDEIRDRRFMRFITARMNEQLLYNGEYHDLYNSIEFYINPLNSEYFFTGDIVTIDYTYYLVMTPACYIENKKCEEIMLCEINFEEFRKLKRNIRSNLSQNLKQRLRELINNKDPNIHFLPPTIFFEGGIVEFKNNKKVNLMYFQENKIIKYRVSNIFMKDIINRFSLFLRNNENVELSKLADFYSKQGQPALDFDEILDLIENEESD